MHKAYIPVPMSSKTVDAITSMARKENTVFSKVAEQLIVEAIALRKDCAPRNITGSGTMGSYINHQPSGPEHEQEH